MAFLRDLTGTSEMGTVTPLPVPVLRVGALVAQARLSGTEQVSVLTFCSLAGHGG